MRTPASLAALALAAVGALAALPGSARAQGARLIARDPRTSEWTTGPIQARVGEIVEVTIAIREPDGSLYADVPRVRWDGRTRAARPLPPIAEVRFSRVAPRMEHVETPSPNEGIPAFSNAVLTGPRHGDWLGLDSLEYVQRPLAPGDAVDVEGARARVREVRPSEPGRAGHGGAGSMWLAAEVVLADARVLRTPDARDADRFGLSREVLRVSMREADDYVGWLSTYFFVPNVFGSSGPGRDHQTERYVGADCADVLIGARRAMGADVPYVSVAGLSRVASPVGAPAILREDGVLVDDAGASLRLAWGRDVMRGDLVAIEYVGAGELPRAWDHVGALVADADGDGALGGGDVLRHMTHQGLADRTLRREGRIRLRIWRFRERR